MGGEEERVLKQELDQDFSLCYINRKPLKLQFRYILMQAALSDCYIKVQTGEQVLESVEVC
jgi:hypothetical protein